MKKSGLAFIGFVFSIMFLASFVSAGVYFSDLDSKYNLGDMVDLNVRVDPFEEGLLLNVGLYCSDQLVIEFNNYPDDDGNVNIKLPLNFNTIDQANGNCYFSGFYDDENRKSMNFEISKLLIVRLGNDAFFANPGEEIIVTGQAEKLNGNVVNGEVEITIPLLDALEVDDVIIEPEEDEDDAEEEEVLSSVVEEETEEETLESNQAEDEDDAEEETSEETEEETTSEEVGEEVAEGDEATEEYDAGTFYGKVVGGDFSVVVKIPDNAPAGDFRIDAFVYEEDKGEKSSEGISYANLKVFQILSDIDLNLNNQNFDPGSVMEIRPKLLDQSGININDEVSVVIRNEGGERFYEKIVRSNEGIDYDLPRNFPSGDYEIEAINGDVNVVRSFFVNQKAIVDFELVGDTLVVTNVGNIPYTKNIEIELNGRPFVKDVDLDLAESTSFKLTGGEDSYNIKVSDGNSELSQAGVSLTGRVVDVDKIGGSLNLTSPIFWIFFFIILLLVVLFLFRNVLKKKSFALHGLMKKKSSEKDHVAHHQMVTPENKVKPVSSPVQNNKSPAATAPEVKRTDSQGKVVHNQADQVLVMKGHRSKAAVLVVKVKNKLGENEKKSLEHAMEPVYAKKGAVYEQGDYVFAIFSPLMTKVQNNEALAAVVGQGIIAVLNEHNKKFREKIDFGIAINSGEIINKVEAGKLKFTAMGNFVVAAKRLAEVSNRQVLLSKESFQKAGSEIKAEKVSDGMAYDLRRVVDSEKNNKFIQGFLERQKNAA